MKLKMVILISSILFLMIVIAALGYVKNRSAKQDIYTYGYRNNDTASPIIVARAKGLYSDDSSEDRDDNITEPIIAAKAKGI